MRFYDEVQRYMHLDYGPCGVDGPTDPVVYEDRFISAKVEVPRKCVQCTFLFYHPIYGFTCRKDKDKWGDCYRGLDWGTWSPDRIYLELTPPKSTTKMIVDSAYADDLISFVTEYRRVNPDLSLTEAREDFARLREIITLREAAKPNNAEQSGDG